MKPTFWNRVRLWWHCLWKMHREEEEWYYTNNPDIAYARDIYCADCKYGNEGPMSQRRNNV